MAQIPLNNYVHLKLQVDHSNRLHFHTEELLLITYYLLLITYYLLLITCYLLLLLLILLLKKRKYNFQTYFQDGGDAKLFFTKNQIYSFYLFFDFVKYVLSRLRNFVSNTLLLRL